MIENTINKVIVDTQDASATIWLNQPSILNALNPLLIKELVKSLKWVAEDKKVRVILIRGRGDSFCSGADLNWMLNSAKPGKSGYLSNLREIKSLASLFKTIYDSDKVVINMLHGNVYGGALGFVGAGDITIALRNTILRLPELKLGLAPAVIMPYLLTRLKIQEFRVYMLTGMEINAEHAKSAGLIDFVCDDMDEMERKAEDLIHNIVRTSAEAVADAKSLLRRMNHSVINSDNISSSVEVLTNRMRSDDARHRIKKLLIKE
jgi:methylglutaconyl-CoA hydratase